MMGFMWIKCPRWNSGDSRNIIRDIASSPLQRVIDLAVRVGGTYHVWRAKNQSRVDSCVSRPQLLFRQIKEDISRRAQGILRGNLSSRDTRWLDSLGICISE